MVLHWTSSATSDRVFGKFEQDFERVIVILAERY